MKLKIIFIFLFGLLSLSCFSAYAQDQEVDEEKQLEESIEKALESMDRLLNLESWQMFYMDSIMRHDYKALREELKQLRASKATNTDLYSQIQDKWTEQMYNSIHGVLDEAQWNKYQKSGAAREKKARDKRIAKRQKVSEK